MLSWCRPVCLFEDNMERNVPSLLLIHLVFFILSAPPCAASSVNNISMVIVVPTVLGQWHTAQGICRKHHDDLVTITNEEEANKLAPYSGWIGLSHFDAGIKWRWSRGFKELTYKNWDHGYPHSGEKCVWKPASQTRWKSDDCDEFHPFICEQRLTLVLETKTWEEALEHCRADGGRDLVGISKDHTFLWNKENIKAQATTDEVWVGLRFLADEWIWLNGRTEMNSDLAHCPAQLQRCGALHRSEEGWKTLNCTEKRNFLCGKK